MTYKCKVCSQPIPREAVIKTAAGGYTDGCCQRHVEETADVSSTILPAPEGREDGKAVE